ncbi:uncharacterized protein Bfra_000107 [Botrytis fragariae]|uniref:Rho-GAP domain-containing protein n=1 Tax=Botrytis fragariae TaxID=1964551 RepID=A0A8H6B2Q1_9HELO|nr:uncharacterized protein Bfra_000107 [Botrytis fragariae]KAF5877942.1 hypothetical protein Bfra_000107 [Botrytis fragariae]
MARKNGLQPLTLEPGTGGRVNVNGTEFINIQQSPRSPLSAKSPRSPRSPFKFNTKKSQSQQQTRSQAQEQEQQLQLQQQEQDQQLHLQLQEQGQYQRDETSSMQEVYSQTSKKDSSITIGSGSGSGTGTGSGIPTSQTLPSLSSFQSSSSPRTPDKGVGIKEKPSRTGFFSNYKASKVQVNFNHHLLQIYHAKDTDRPAMSGKVSSQDTKRSGTTHPVSSLPLQTIMLLESGPAGSSLVRKPVGVQSRSDASLASSTNDSPQQNSDSNSINNRKNKPKQFSLLGRTRSLRDDNSPAEPSPPKNNYLDPDLSTHQYTHTSSSSSVKTTTPARSDDDRNCREMSTPTNHRQRSEDRQHSRSRENRGKDSMREHTKDHTKDNSRNQSSFSTTFKEAGGHAFFNNIKSQATKGAGAIHKNLFGKGGRSGSSTHKEPSVDDEHYVLKVINKPLVEQTRLTRISKRLEDSRDKTEFWMPSFPWRAIDYLNYKGSDVEGLYRVPGSGPQVKKWQRRFDEELDIDLFECDDLYDINIIGSMLKAWLRELPDELLPRAAQDRIARECAGSDEVPQQLVEELSNLSPFNYYLLFAITCHLSLLLAHSEKNKMDFRNLCICFQPCMKMDAFCFKFLVCDWRDCWKGCKTEAMPPGSAGGRSSTAVESHDERNVSSSDSSKPSSVSLENQGRKHSHEKGRKASGEKNQRRSPDSERSQRQIQVENHREGAMIQSNSMNSIDTVSTTLTVIQATPPRNGDMRPLSPIKPLSPIGF